MKQSGFKTKYSTLKKSKSMKQFREVEGEDENVLQVSEADRLFSIEIRKRDGQCVNCGSTLFLGCSHYFSRGIYALRYDPENCITLCQECHENWEHEKDGVYKDFMIMWLGEEEFEVLKYRSKMKINPYQAITEFMKSNILQSDEIEY